MKLLGRLLAVPWGWLKALGRLLQRLFRSVTAPLRWGQRAARSARAFFTAPPEDEAAADSGLPTDGSFVDLLAGAVEHIDALRRHLLRAVIVLALTTTLSFLFADRLMAILAVPLGDNAQTELLALTQLPWDQAVARFFALGAAGIAKMQVIEPTESVGVFMRVSLLAGTAFAMPYIVLEVFLFVAPALYPRSRVRLLLSLPAISLLFLAGLAFTYLIMLPAAIPFLQDFMGFRAAWRPTAYFGLVTNLMFWIGVAFQMPLIIYVLATIGLLRTQQLVSQWRLAVVIIAVIAAAITPTTDPVNMGLVMLPMSLLYVVSIIGAWFAERGRALRHREA